MQNTIQLSKIQSQIIEYSLELLINHPDFKDGFYHQDNTKELINKFFDFTKTFK
jgi:hypothetical protein